MSAVAAPRLALSGHDLYLFREGTHSRLYQKLGAHLVEGATEFAVWAPNASSVAVVGDFNGWDPRRHPMRQTSDASGIWYARAPEARQGSIYKYHIVSKHAGYRVDKADPYAFRCETPPKTGSVVWDLDYQWRDEEWTRTRGRRNALDAPQSVYEVHLGSWMRSPDHPEGFLGYRDLAPKLAEYAKRMGFTHVELMPIMEHPFYGSWGYQCTGYFAASSRYGTPQDLMWFVDQLHQAGIGVILDWVPSHFPWDPHGLGFFDGTHLYEHSDPRQGHHPDWASAIFNYGRNEVRAFLGSSAHFWLEIFHADGLRVDAVASMLYLDYGRKHDEWIPNAYGGKENLDAIEFLEQLNVAVGRDFPDTRTIAEESTSWPSVSRPVFAGGLGFSMKWNMGWMHDTLDYFSHDPIYRRYHHNNLTFSLWYAFSENFTLPLSHDEVVYGKKSLISKMPGDRWQQFANLRLLFGYMWTHPGKKLLFMGGEFGQWKEWAHEGQLDWALAQQEEHAGLQRWVSDLNRAYREKLPLHELDFSNQGFQWVDNNDSDNSILTYLRLDKEGTPCLCVCNFTPVVRENYRVGVDVEGVWSELMNTDSHHYGGSGIGNLGEVETAPVPWHGRPFSINVTLPPLAVLFFKPL